MRPAILAAVGVGLVLAAAGALAAPVTKRTLVPFEELFRAAGAAHGVDWRLIAAHAYVESSFVPKAHNPEGSSGLMQILLPLARNTGVVRHMTLGRLPEFANIDESRIFEPEYNISLGAALIRENIKAFGLPRAIAVYNMDKSRLAPTAGPFVNQGYVDKVRAKARELGMQI